VKLVSPVRKDLEQLAAERGYPVDVAAAMVDPDVELLRLLVEDERGRLKLRFLSTQALAEQPAAFRARVKEQRVAASRQVSKLARECPLFANTAKKTEQT